MRTHARLSLPWLAALLSAACGSASPAGQPSSPTDRLAIEWGLAPTAIDFGAVPPGERVERRLTLSNPGPAALPVAAALLPGADPAIALASVPAVVPAGGAADLVVAYAPTAPGSHGAWIRLEAGGRTREVGASGLSPGVWLSCMPEVLDLPPVATGEESRGVVSCLAGAWAPADARVRVEPPVVSGAGFAATFAAPPPAEGLAPGAFVSIDVAFRADGPGLHEGRLALPTSAGEVAVPLSARTWAVAPCDLALPGVHDLGLVPPGLRARVEVPLENRRPDAGCRIASARLASCDPGFRLADAGPLVLGPGERRPWTLRFDATTGGSWRCELVLGLDDGAREARIPLRAFVDPSCLHVSPGLDFGETLLGCAAAEPRTLAVHSACGPTVSLQGFDEAAPFVVTSAPLLPLPLATGDRAEFELEYRPGTAGEDTATLRLRFADGIEPVPVALRGAVSGPETEDVFRQDLRPKADVLFVIDNSTAMAEVQQTLTNNLRPFLSIAMAQQIDFRIGVTTTGLEPGGACPGGVGGGEDGRLVPVDGSRVRWIDPQTPNLEQVWFANYPVGACRSGPSRPLEAAVRALTPPLSDHADDPRHPEPNDGNGGFLRPDAHLSVIFITNRADESPGTVAGYLADLFALKPNRHWLMNLHAVSGDPGTGCSRPGVARAVPGDRLVWAVEHTDGGVFQSICEPDWSTAFREMSAEAFGFKTCFFLSYLPADLDGDGTILDADLEVRQDGRVIASRAPQGQQIWQYWMAGNAVCFNPLSVPEPGDEIRVRYTRTCE
jgi:hypothetical protein